MAKLVRRHTSNVEIVGSNPTGSSIFFCIEKAFFDLIDLSNQALATSFFICATTFFGHLINIYEKIRIIKKSKIKN